MERGAKRRERTPPLRSLGIGEGIKEARLSLAGAGARPSQGGGGSGAGGGRGRDRAVHHVPAQTPSFLPSLPVRSRERPLARDGPHAGPASAAGFGSEWGWGAPPPAPALHAGGPLHAPAAPVTMRGGGGGRHGGGRRFGFDDDGDGEVDALAAQLAGSGALAGAGAGDPAAAGAGEAAATPRFAPAALALAAGGGGGGAAGPALVPAPPSGHTMAQRPMFKRRPQLCVSTEGLSTDAAPYDAAAASIRGGAAASNCSLVVDGVYAAGRARRSVHSCVLWPFLRAMTAVCIPSCCGRSVHSFVLWPQCAFLRAVAAVMPP